MTISFKHGGLALFATILLLLGGFVPQALAQSDSNDVLNRLRVAYSSMDALRADFTQSVGSSSMEGTITLQGDKYRIETSDQVLVTDGNTAWAYTRDDNQVLINDYIEDVTAFAPSAFFTRYPDRFDIRVTDSETIRGARHDVLQLTPRTPDPNVREIRLFVRASDSLPARLRLVDSNGTVLTFDLRNIERNPRLATDTFQFRAPAGAEVVDLRG
jgi:outer membrane lipoprotein carrier protein